MKVSKAILTLAALVMVLAIAGTVGGILSQEPGSAVGARSVRGEDVELFGRGLYRNDPVFAGANFRAQDIVTLLIGVPLLAAALLWYRHGSLRGGLLLAGVFGYFLYEYASMSFMAAFNSFFLVYVALMSTSLYGLILTMSAAGHTLSDQRIRSSMPRRFVGWYLIAAGVITTVVWLVPLVGAQLAGTIPDRLDHNTTMVTDALDLAVITPACFIAGVLILRRRSFGYVVSMPLLVTIVMLVFLITGGTISQIAEGIDFTPGEIAGPISGFAVLGLLGIVLLRRVLRSVEPR